jgi:hypothetical protein
MPDDPGEDAILVAAVSDVKLLGGEKVWQKIDIATLRENLRNLLGGVEKALPEPEPRPEPGARPGQPRFRMTEITVAVTVGAKGQVGLLGTGVEASGQASLTVKLTRS